MNNNLNFNPGKPRKQQGAVLTVSLIMLFLLSILGLAVMRTSTLEEKMAANSLHEDVAFQAAETISEETISEAANLTAAYNSSNGTEVVDFQNEHMDGITASATISYSGFGNAYGFSIGVDSGNFKAYRFVSDSVGEISDANTSSRIIQGAYRVAPGGPDE